MDEIEVVIRIPEEWIEQFKAFKNPSTLETIILQGAVLPKGHGRLVDADAMVKILRESEYYQEKREDFYGAEVTSRVKNFIEDTDTVIEADKEEE